MRRGSFLPLLCAFFLCGCGQRALTFNETDPLDAKVSGERALDQVTALVGFGPRPAGSEAIEGSRKYLEGQLAALGWEVRRQTFTAQTPRGKIEFTNLRARFGSKAWEGLVQGLLCSHYDTKYYEGFSFVGANDAGSSTGLLVELARVLAERPGAASQIELVFFDGEEALGTNITANDGLYGSKHYASEWLTFKESHRPRWGVLLDMVGDADLNIRAAVRIPGPSIRELVKANADGSYVIDIVSVEKVLGDMSKDLLKAASELDFRSQVGVSGDYIIDDHIPLNVVAGIPTINLIDFDYPHWHTPADTLDKVSAESLGITGKVTMRFVERYLLGR